LGGRRGREEGCRSFKKSQIEEHHLRKGAQKDLKTKQKGRGEMLCQGQGSSSAYTEDRPPEPGEKEDCLC